MNRLLLRSFPSEDEPTRVEVFFQYVQYLDAPLAFETLDIEVVTEDAPEHTAIAEAMARYPECRLYRLTHGGSRPAYVVAAACLYGQDSSPAGSESMFPMMT